MTRTKVLLDVAIESLDRDIEMAESDHATALLALESALSNPDADNVERFRCNAIVGHAENYRNELERIRRDLFSARCAMSRTW